MSICNQVTVFRHQKVALKRMLPWRFHIAKRWLCIPPKSNMTWKINHEWRCISYWQWGIFECHVSFQGGIPKSSSSCHPKLNTNQKYRGQTWTEFTNLFFLMSGRFRIFILLWICHPKKITRLGHWLFARKICAIHPFVVSQPSLMFLFW